MGIVYITTNKINDRKYIGVDTQNNNHYFGSGVAIKLAIKKYGVENFTKEIIESSDDKNYLFEREKYWIEHYNAVESKEFYNMSLGGKGGNMLISEDSIKRHKEGSQKSVITNIEKRKGKTYEEIYGKKSKEEKEKRRLAGLGQKQSEERKRKNSEKHKGLITWNKGLTKDTDERVKKNIENRISPEFFKVYELTTPTDETLIFQGKNKLESYLKKVNNELKFKNRINCDKLIKDGNLKDYRLKVE